MNILADTHTTRSARLDGAMREMCGMMMCPCRCCA